MAQESRGRRRWVRLVPWVAALGLAGAAGCSTGEAASGTARGETLYAGCAPCHGPQGGGNADVGAPAIAGLQPWYVKAQVEKFQDGRRGAHPDDFIGLRMRPMSRWLRSPEDVEAVAAYVASLPKVRGPATLEGGDPARGQAAYATCQACHGADGKGNEALKAPDLTGLPDWYLRDQIAKFKDGRRGYHPKDVEGAQMRGMVATLADDQAVLDVIAHIRTLGQ